MITDQMRYQGCMMGLAAGDALGTTVEFKPPGSFFPLTDMVGGGPFGLEPEQWTDGTSMALCLADSLIEKRGFDLKDQMERYRRWYSEGYMSSNGRCFDIGRTVLRALANFEATGNPISGKSVCVCKFGLFLLGFPILSAFIYNELNILYVSELISLR